MERAGLIHNLELQPKYPIVIKGKHCFNYIADFRYVQDGKTIVEDSKGMRTSIYRLKRKCVIAEYGIEILET